MNHYSQSSPDDIAAAVKNKTVEGVSVVRSGAKALLVFRFTDGSELRLVHDWIYGWEVREGGAAPVALSDVRFIIEEDRPKVIKVKQDPPKIVKIKEDSPKVSKIKEGPPKVVANEEDPPKAILIYPRHVYQAPVTRAREMFLSIANTPRYEAARPGDFLDLHGSRYAVLAVKNLGSALRITVERAGRAPLDRW